MNKEEISKRIVAIFRPFDPDKIILFGSSVRGHQDAFSDVDLIVVYSTQKAFMSRLRDLYETWDIPKAVDILAYTPEEFQEMLKHSYFVQCAVNEGCVIYERARERD
jgi:predicted nucleotidyltransferase